MPEVTKMFLPKLEVISSFRLGGPENPTNFCGRELYPENLYRTSLQVQSIYGGVGYRNIGATVKRWDWWCMVIHPRMESKHHGWKYVKMGWCLRFGPSLWGSMNYTVVLVVHLSCAWQICPYVGINIRRFTIGYNIPKLQMSSIMRLWRSICGSNWLPVIGARKVRPRARGPNWDGKWPVHHRR